MISQRIFDVCIFTSTTFNESSLKEISDLKAYLTKKGLTVHGVITPNDFAWHLDENTIDKFQKQFNQIADPSKDSSLQQLIKNFASIQSLSKEMMNLRNFQVAPMKVQ